MLKGLVNPLTVKILLFAKEGKLDFYAWASGEKALEKKKKMSAALMGLG